MANEADEFFSIFPRNMVNTLHITSVDYKLFISIPIKTLKDEGEFEEDMYHRSGHYFRLNGKELKILKKGAGEDDHAQITYSDGETNLLFYFDDEDDKLFNKRVDLLLRHTIAPIEGGRRRSTYRLKNSRKYSHKYSRKNVR